MTYPHPITPPQELVQQWITEIWHEGTPVSVAISDRHLASKAAQWGADQELEACVQWTKERTIQFPDGTWPQDVLRAARRPKPPTLKEQALQALDKTWAAGYIKAESADTIRHALEQLP